jgi:hypothetical protein
MVFIADSSISADSSNPGDISDRLCGVRNQSPISEHILNLKEIIFYPLMPGLSGTTIQEK